MDGCAYPGHDLENEVGEEDGEHALEALRKRRGQAGEQGLAHRAAVAPRRGDRGVDAQQLDGRAADACTRRVHATGIRRAHRRTRAAIRTIDQMRTLDHDSRHDPPVHGPKGRRVVSNLVATRAHESHSIDATNKSKSTRRTIMFGAKRKPSQKPGEVWPMTRVQMPSLS